MNFTHLAAFFAVVETGSVTAAAERIHVSQPALTREIKELEDRLGVSLFERLPRGMQPTEAGSMLASYAAQIFSLADAAETTIGEFAGLERGHLVFGASRTIGVFVLPHILHEFGQRYPGVSVEMSVSNTEEIEGGVSSGSHQIGFVEGSVNESAFEAQPVGRDELIAVASPSHPLAGKRRVSASALIHAGLVTREPGSGTRRAVEQAYAAHGLELKAMLSIGSTDAIKRFLRMGHAVTWISRHAVIEELASKALVQLHVSGLRIERQFYLIRRKSAVLSPSAKAFVELASRRLKPG
ncbi:LysR family transcriptional regulator [Burkholderia ubonensis]|uniref:LysR family transcriptional regulator n=1 Tax=Burkholderia ubonensis TaxID=101571 RepID=UPI00075F1CB2|nr:LysR family transcriptional regulator [Burkholderia ubonensis]KVM60343.1 LysR family transcriptional regulator [Burkholderia ubonensis]